MIVVRVLLAAWAAVVGLRAPDRRRGRDAESRRAAATAGPAADRVEPSVPAAPPSRAVRVARTVLIAVGAVLIGVGFGLVAAGVPAGQWAGIALWLAGALVLHDAVLAPLLLIGNLLLRRAGAGALPWASVAVVQVALIVGGVLTLLAFPALRAQAIGARNPSVLPFDYGAHLAVAWAVIGVVVVAAAIAGRVRRAR